MDFSIVGPGAPLFSESDVKSIVVNAEYNLPYLNEKPCIQGDDKGFINVLHETLSGKRNGRLFERKLPVNLPASGKLLPVFAEVGEEMKGQSEERSGFNRINLSQEDEIEFQSDELFSGLLYSDGEKFSVPYILDSRKGITHAVEEKKSPGVGFSPVSVAAEIGSSIPLAVRPANQILPLHHQPVHQQQMENAMLLEKDNALPLISDGILSLDSQQVSMRNMAQTEETALIWRDAGKSGDDPEVRMSGTGRVASNQTITSITNSTAVKDILIPFVKEKPLQLSGDSDSLPVRPGQVWKENSGNFIGNGNNQSTGLSLNRSKDFPNTVNATPLQYSAGVSPLTEQIQGSSVVAVPPSLTRSQFADSIEDNIDPELKNRGKGLSLSGNTANNFQVLNKAGKEASIHSVNVTANEGFGKEPLLSPSTLENDYTDIPMMANRQTPVPGGKLPNAEGTAMFSRHSAINVPVGHAAWEQNLARQVLQAGHAQLRQLHIRLNPSHLGSIEIRLQLEGDSANIAFSSQHAVVRDAVEASLPRLREMFSGSGINLGDVDVGGQNSAREQERDAHSGDLSSGGLISVGDNDEQAGGGERRGLQFGKGKDDNQLLDYYV